MPCVDLLFFWKNGNRSVKFYCFSMSTEKIDLEEKIRREISQFFHKSTINSLSFKLDSCFQRQARPLLQNGLSRCQGSKNKKKDLDIYIK